MKSKNGLLKIVIVETEIMPEISIRIFRTKQEKDISILNQKMIILPQNYASNNLLPANMQSFYQTIHSIRHLLLCATRNICPCLSAPSI